MKKIVLLALFSLFIFPCYSQDFESEENDSFEQNRVYVGEMTYRGTTYRNCSVEFYHDTDTTFNVIIAPKRDSATFWRPFELYLSIRSSDDLPPVYGGFPSILCQSYINGEQNGEILNSEFVKYYEDWPSAYHVYQTFFTRIYIRDFTEKRYVISGHVVVSNSQNDIVQFVFFDKMKYSPPEVLKIRMYSMEDMKENAGFFKMDTQKITTPFAFQQYDYENNKQKLFITDKNLVTQTELGYGICFEMESDNGKLPFGTYSSESSSSVIFASFFNNEGEIEFPDKAFLEIAKKGKTEYTIKYELFIAGKEIKGNYNGLVPRRDKD